MFFVSSSYPYSEDSSQGKQYMPTRCPAWCDRILMSATARDLVLKVSSITTQALNKADTIAIPSVYSVWRDKSRGSLIIPPTPQNDVIVSSRILYFE